MSSATSPEAITEVLSTPARKDLRGRYDLTPSQRIALQSERDPSSGCLLMFKKPSTSGYVQIRVDGRLVLAHRHVFEQAHGPIPDGMEIDHTCNVARCIAIDHLQLVSRSKNTRLSYRRDGRAPSKRVLEPDDVLEIRSLLRLGFKQRVLAERFGVSRTHICAINRGRSWAGLQ